MSTSSDVSGEESSRSLSTFNAIRNEGFMGRCFVFIRDEVIELLLACRFISGKSGFEWRDWCVIDQQERKPA